MLTVGAKKEESNNLKSSQRKQSDITTTDEGFSKMGKSFRRLL